MALLARLNCFKITTSKFTNIALTSAPKLSLTKSPLPKFQSNTTQTRTVFKWFKRPTQRDLKTTDNIPDEYTMIYRNTMTKYIHGGQIIMTLTTVLVLMALCFGDRQNKDLYYETWSLKTKSVKNEEYVYLASFAILIVLLHFTIVRVPLRIYKVPKTQKYILINPGNFPFNTARVEFQQGQLVQMEETGILPWRENRFLIKKPTDNHKIILMEHYFRRPADLYVMLGVQKDSDD